jgi:hypothetical protein
MKPIAIYKYFFTLLFVFSITFAFGQNTKYDEIIIKDKIYKPGSSWLKIGEGYGFHKSINKFELNTLISGTFRIKNLYFQGGYHVSSDKFFTQPTYQKLNDFYIATGWRKETQKANITAFIGPTYAYGGTFDHAVDTGGVVKNWYRGFSELGIYGCIDYTFKIFYDLGFGISIYGSANKEYSVVGIQAHFYFSGAFKGEIK